VRALRDPGLIFPSRVTTTKPVDLRTPWETALKRAGIERFRWHDMRHSAASFLAANGASLLEIGAVLGHKSPATTKRYAHLTEQHTHDLVRAMTADLFEGK
ncbi:MAG: site-specific integrase, partial [Sphingobacteriia bacterium]|nr:site-specific integrase [Sphingobacteriia bacterium]